MHPLLYNAAMRKLQRTIAITAKSKERLHAVHVSSEQSQYGITVAPYARGEVHLRIDDATEAEITVALEPHAHLTLLCSSVSLLPQHIVQRHAIGAGAELHAVVVVRGSAYTHEVFSVVGGENGKSTIDFLFVAQKNDRQRMTIQNTFRAPSGGGEITIHGIAEDHAHVAIDGKIEIGPKGRGTHTHLTQHVLMLDHTARVDAIPALEIRCNDVKASHSATVSKVSEEDIFYASSRGISATQARDLLVRGFLYEHLAHMPESIRDRTERALFTAH